MLRAKWLQTNSNLHIIADKTLFMLGNLHKEKIESLTIILTESTSDLSARDIEENHGGKSTATRHRKQRRCTIAERN